ncbi:hypothetical protein D1609_07635 [Leptospira borgpetersenii serovar Hardjo-bovis]|nr:hypothetical protein D1609_07635 [Leptospira borgpetersenii serovar Hardjo-bovis]TQE55283.1 hypothetical protein FFZ95_01250 [Leptospira borgpetersenii]TQE59535.1 hypothetical protein FFZ96_00565 [Leptospira borgpetersenii]
MLPYVKILGVVPKTHKKSAQLFHNFVIKYSNSRRLRPYELSNIFYNCQIPVWSSYIPRFWDGLFTVVNSRRSAFSGEFSFRKHLKDMECL